MTANIIISNLFLSFFLRQLNKNNAREDQDNCRRLFHVRDLFWRLVAYMTALVDVNT